jgi:hypothetical protein
MLDGVNKQMSPKQMPLLFNQGEDMVFTIYLEIDGKPLDLAIKPKNLNGAELYITDCLP